MRLLAIGLLWAFIAAAHAQQAWPSRTVSGNQPGTRYPRRRPKH